MDLHVLQSIELSVAELVSGSKEKKMLCLYCEGLNLFDTGLEIIGKYFKSFVSSRLSGTEV